MFNFFGREIPVYGFMGIIGVTLGIVFLVVVCKLKKRSADDSLYVLVWGAVGAMVGAKILYIIVDFKSVVSLFRQYPDQIFMVIRAVLSSGFVFYGGLGGALLGVFLASRYFELKVLEQMNICIPAMPLAHGFGRIGCHLLGCCHGMEYHGPFSVVYHNSPVAPLEVELFPVQLLESIFDFALFAVFVVLLIMKKYENRFIYIYLAAYSIARFILEFFRGDSIRGKFIGISTSQWISIAIWITLITMYIYKKHHDVTCRTS